MIRYLTCYASICLTFTYIHMTCLMLFVCLVSCSVLCLCIMFLMICYVRHVYVCMLCWDTPYVTFTLLFMIYMPVGVRPFPYVYVSWYMTCMHHSLSRHCSASTLPQSGPAECGFSTCSWTICSIVICTGSVSVLQYHQGDLWPSVLVVEPSWLSYLNVHALTSATCSSRFERI